MMLSLYHIINAPITIMNLDTIEAKIALDTIKQKTKNLFKAITTGKQSFLSQNSTLLKQKPGVIGNGEAKELICMTHGHELRWGGGNAGE